MKSALIYGAITGGLSVLWMFIMHGLGYEPQVREMSPIEFASVLIPVIGLYFGVKHYRDHDCKGQMGFLEGLMQAFKILLAGGIIAGAASIIYIEEFAHGKNLFDFSGRIFGALLVGILLSLSAALLLTTSRNKVD